MVRILGGPDTDEYLTNLKKRCAACDCWNGNAKAPVKYGMTLLFHTQTASVQVPVRNPPPHHGENINDRGSSGRQCLIENCEACNTNGTCISCVNGTTLYKGNCTGGLNYHPFKWYHMPCAIHNFYNGTDYFPVKVYIRTQTVFNFINSHQ